MKRGMRTQKYTSSSAGTKRSSLPPIPRKNGKQKAKLSIRQAIDEALDDYTAEHIKEYSNYDSELTPLSPVKDVVFQEVEPIPSADDTKRRHSFDLQVTKSPILDAMKDKQVVEPLELEESSELERRASQSPGPTLFDFQEMSNRLFDILFSGSSTSVIPVKSMMSPKQESDIRQLFLDVVMAEGTLPKQRDSARGDSEEVIVFHYFPKRVLSDLVYQLRYESPYGQSSRCSVLDRLARFDLALEEQVAGFVGQYLLQFVLDERELVIQSDDDFATIQKQIGGLHRFVTLFESLVDVRNRFPSLADSPNGHRADTSADVAAGPRLPDARADASALCGVHRPVANGRGEVRRSSIGDDDGAVLREPVSDRELLHVSPDALASWLFRKDGSADWIHREPARCLATSLPDTLSEAGRPAAVQAHLSRAAGEPVGD